MPHPSQQAETGYSKASVNTRFEPSDASNGDWNISGTGLHGNSNVDSAVTGVSLKSAASARVALSRLTVALSFEELAPVQFAPRGLRNRPFGFG